MAAKFKFNPHLEIAHVLFIDVVGYSKLLVNEQREVVEQLNRIVRRTPQFRKSEAAGKLIRIPVGDGMALVFFQTPEEPVQCAMEIARALKNHPQIRLRMGVHSGPIDQVKDVNDRLNVAGAGINMAQRVMACGDAGHILLSKRVAEDLAQDKLWQPHLHELGEIEVKHGRKLGIVNLYSEEMGNPNVPEKLKGASRQPTERPVRVGWPRLIKIAALLLVCLLAAIAAIVMLHHRGTYLPSTQTLTSPASLRETSVAEKSIAVLPFENLSHDPDNAYFADGIQEEILARLARIADLKVISRTSTQHYKSSPDNLPQIAKRLGVANILEGSVQKSADKVRVNVELIRAATDAHLWADTFDRKLTDVFAIESEVARTIAGTLQAKLTGAEQNAIAARPTENTEAYQLYLKGRYFWNKRTGENLKKAADYFNQAIAADPKYALAYVGLADAYALMPIYGPVRPRDCSPKAKAAAAKALELDDGLAEAHTSLAQVLFYDLDFSQATKEFQRAIELNPNYASAHQWFGSNLLSALGRFDEAIAETRRALELDPLSLIINAEIGRSYIYARRFDEAIDQLRKTIELDGNFYTAHWDLGEALEAKGLIDPAIEEYKKVREITGNPQIAGFLGHAYAVRGQRDEALKMLAQLKDESTRGYVPAYCFAIVNLGLGDKDEALRWLEKDFDDLDGWQIGFIKVNPALDPLRGDPRFEALVAKVFAHKDAISGATTRSP
jgi:TolB-like protein/Tfp pilus assembly protein PilF